MSKDWVDALIAKAYRLGKALNDARNNHRDCTKDAVRRMVYDSDGKPDYSVPIETDDMCECHARWGKKYAELARQVKAIVDELDRACKKAENRVAYDSRKGRWYRL